MRCQCCPSLPVGTQVRQHKSEKQKSTINQQNRQKQFEYPGQSPNTNRSFANPSKAAQIEGKQNDTIPTASDNGTGAVPGGQATSSSSYAKN